MALHVANGALGGRAVSRRQDLQKSQASFLIPTQSRERRRSRMRNGGYIEFFQHAFLHCNALLHQRPAAAVLAGAAHGGPHTAQHPDACERGSWSPQLVSSRLLDIWRPVQQHQPCYAGQAGCVRHPGCWLAPVHWRQACGSECFRLRWGDTGWSAWCWHPRVGPRAGGHAAGLPVLEQTMTVVCGLSQPQRFSNETGFGALCHMGVPLLHQCCSADVGGQGFDFKSAHEPGHWVHGPSQC